MDDTVILFGGEVQYSMDEAKCSIEELIDTLQQAQQNGAEYVVMESGNYRGPKWMSISPDYQWPDE